MPEFKGITRDQVQERIERFDDNEDGLISYSESLIQTLDGAAFVSLATDNQRELFDEGDVDADGYLTPAEMKQLIINHADPADKEVIELWFTEEMIYDEFAASDIDQDRKWSYEEMGDEL